MNADMILSDLFVWGIGFIVLQITAFVIFVVKMNMKIENVRIERIKDKENLELELTEIKADMEDQRIAHNKRIEEVTTALSKHYDSYHNENNLDHREIKKAMEVMMAGISEIQKQVSYMSGVLDQHIGNGHKSTTPRSVNKRS